MVLSVSGFVHLEPMTDSSGTVDDYEVRPITARAFPTERTDGEDLPGSRLATTALKLETVPSSVVEIEKAISTIS